ncbi:MAG TPA: hypothetical protein PLL17_08420 [Defluviitaleaceae bacterium]|nr:hypothetical protein [Candidatus Epulonipiscium sp.]HOQ16706.1 hypothetical protein [Defluviitaleaceae bacterium]HPT75116.1 hypothetical protein [Defluviitaleaceae bacterium]HQD51134.1 hypothetical protein [Defluviitaleaceae bacterium]
MKRLIIHMIFFCFILTACQMSKSNIQQATYSQEEELPLSEDLFEKSDYKLFILKNKSLSLYEPVNQCYIGAYILSNADLNFDIEIFEDKTQKSHGIYLRNLKLGKAFPIDWVLECTAKMKTPLVILHPPSIHYPYQEYLLEETAKAFGEYYIPMFVEWYPDPQQYGNAKEYKDFFMKAREIFKEYAPNVAFVWGVNHTNVKDSMLYYPGDDAVDWVAVHVYDMIEDKNLAELDSSNEKIFQDIEFFYFLFQDKKPIMISQLAISHYSKHNHAYYVDEAAQKIKDFYTRVKSYYPAIKAVNYMDFDNIEAAPEGEGYDNFKITAHRNLSEAYALAVKTDYFTDSLDTQHIGQKENYWFVSYYPLYKKGEEFYISEKVIRYEWNTQIFNLKKEEGVIIDGSLYYSLNNLVKDNGLNIIINDREKIIKVQ